MAVGPIGPAIEKAFNTPLGNADPGEKAPNPGPGGVGPVGKAVINGLDRGAKPEAGRASFGLDAHA